mmetsp:Transcript_49604/g.116493  ORF Transcript_49604/g.116493 Transcript_49604/m.116493 type:complete len:216 (-) Transcript_49604:128-775(-)
MTTRVQAAATKSSNRMPKPWAQPIAAPRSALNSRSAQPTGPGLAASKKRNSPKATSWPTKPAGAISHRMSQKASTSSQTTAPGSGVFRCWAQRVQAHQPTRVPMPISSAQARSFIQGAISTATSQAHSVPTVPGAFGLRPLPKPSAIQRAGWRHMKAGVGRTGAPLMTRNGRRTAGRGRPPRRGRRRRAGPARPRCGRRGSATRQHPAGGRPAAP